MNCSGSSTSVRSYCWESDDERVAMGAGAREARFGFIVVGFVPARLRNVSGAVVTIDGDDDLVWLCSCAADNEGLNTLRGVVDPLAWLEERDVISSP
jgi:hypothetical protein